MSFPDTLVALLGAVEEFMPLGKDAIDVAETVGKDVSQHRSLAQTLEDALAAFKADAGL
jgi:hypothetical protein